MTSTTPTHPHTHAAGGEHHHHALPPSGQGTVVLDIGGSVGALVVHTTERLAGREIEIARRGETQQFVHTEVRERHLPDGHVHAAVFAALPEGKYTLLDAPLGADCDVVIAPGCVTEVDWSSG
jgi:hypothetical protein